MSKKRTIKVSSDLGKRIKLLSTLKGYTIEEFLEDAVELYQKHHKIDLDKILRRK